METLALLEGGTTNKVQTQLATTFTASVIVLGVIRPPFVKRRGRLLPARVAAWSAATALVSLVL